MSKQWYLLLRLYRRAAKGLQGEEDGHVHPPMSKAKLKAELKKGSKRGVLMALPAVSNPTPTPNPTPTSNPTPTPKTSPKPSPNQGLPPLLPLLGLRLCTHLG